VIENSLRIGLVGCGRWGRNILRDLCSLGCHVSVADVDAKACSDAQNGGAARTYNQATALPAVDGIVIATPTTDHAETIFSVLDRQVPVFCEKPLTPDAATAMKIARRDRNRRVYMMDKWRYHPGVQALGKIARDGNLGRVQQIHTIRVQWGQPHKDVDGVWILAPHDLSIVHQILGELPAPVYATGEFTDNQMDGMIAVLGRDPVVVINVSARVPLKQRMISLSCSKGVAVLTDPLADHIELWRCTSRNGFDQQPERRSISTRMPLLIELEHFCGYIRGGEEPLTDSVGAAEQVSVIEQLRQMAIHS